MTHQQTARPAKAAAWFSAALLWAGLLWAGMALPVSPAAAQANFQTDFSGAMEQRYCTQSGPLMIRFDRNRAAGFFAALPEPAGAARDRAPGAMAGVLANRTLEGVWTRIDKRGAIRMGFSEDWSSFVAAYSLEDDPENWLSGWMGYLPPAGDPPDFVIDGDSYHCD